MESHEKSWNLKCQKEYEPCVRDGATRAGTTTNRTSVGPQGIRDGATRAGTTTNKTSVGPQGVRGGATRAGTTTNKTSVGPQGIRMGLPELELLRTRLQ